MKCKHCNKDGKFVFTKPHHSFLLNIEKMKAVNGMCFDCYLLIPKHIPYEQYTKFLLEKRNEKKRKIANIKK